ncbi:galactose mutarotase-like domain-containing protein [Armillaria borealis]|uniref:Galactose mutarotase-like domain-containing protein n=1 Tax=Armillaria borealis TaxID=47425 RepID=A0AA39JQI7_9AGAR|nr:galactose mutarotase-like domain-containing protein [Armillaria borealis]
MAEFTPVLLTLPSFTPSLAVEVLPHGLTIHRFIIQADGRTHDIVVGPEVPEDHTTQKYTNTIIGRYANRVPTGTHKLQRNGYEGVLVAQANESARVSLHGGPIGFDSLPWTLLSADTPPTLFSKAELGHFPGDENGSHAIFRLVSPSGDQGYPGELTIEVLISLLAPEPQVIEAGNEFSLGSLVYVYRARVNKGVTPVNLTQHWGFNLEASMKERPGSDVKNHNLTLKADRIVSRDSDSLHTGKYISVASAPEHDHSGKKIGDKYPEPGYDDFYVFESRPIDVPKRVPISTFSDDFDLVKSIITPSTVHSPVALLSSDISGLSLAFDTNQSGVMFYSNIGAVPERDARKKIHGGSGLKGDGLATGTAAFLEFHDVLSAFLDPSNKDGEDGLLTQDELYNNYVRCDVRFKALAK